MCGTASKHRSRTRATSGNASCNEPRAIGLLCLLSDDNFDNHIVRGLVRRMPTIDLVRVQDVGLGQTDDRAILHWAADHGRVLLTHDRRTVPAFALDRVTRGEPMPGVFVVHIRAPVAHIIDDMLLVAQCSDEEDWIDLISYFPLA